MRRKQFLRYSFLLTGLGLLKKGRAFTFYNQGRKLLLNNVRFIWSGAISTNTIKVHASLTNGTSTARLVVSTDQALSSPIFGSYASANAANNYVAGLSVSGLTPGTQYYYGIEADGVVDTATDAIGRVKTFTAGAHSFRFSIASCNSNGNHPVFYRIKDKDPLFHITHGDFHYADPNSATDINVHRQPFENTLAQPAMKEFLRNHAIAYMWDDHDYCGDNTNSLAVGRTNARLVYQEYVPHFPLPAGTGDVPIYQSFVAGRIRFILSDLRSERTAASIMGTTQKTWFKNQCLAAKNNNEAIVWISSVPWGGVLDQDTWAGYTAERIELSDFFKDIGIQNMLIICGDAHMIAIDNGNNHDYATGGNPFRYPVLQAAAVNQTGSFRGGTYSEGFFSNPTQQDGQYALVEFTDNGGNNIAVSLTGYRVNSVGVESVLVTYSFNFSSLDVLPMKVLDFSVAAVQAGKSLVSWQIEYSNIRCRKITVERSSDGSHFEAIGYKDCNGMAGAAHDSYIDERPLSGKSFYRLKLEEETGRFTYSAIESFELHKNVDVTINNPVNGQLILSVTSPAAEKARYVVTDVRGRTLLKNTLQLRKGANNASIGLNGLPAGVYFFILSAGNGQTAKKFVIN